MKVIKPLLLGFLWRTYKRQGDHLALTGLLPFSFSDPEVPLTEQEMWRSVAPLFPPDSAWDEGIPKERGELLLMARAHAPGGIPVAHRQVEIQVGPVSKRLEIFGPRVWIRERGLLRASNPDPFVSIPIDFSHAYGGAGFGPNPTGIGFADPSDGSPRPLPNIEDPSRPILSPDDRPEGPAGLGPLSLNWSQRSGRVGRYRPEELLGTSPPPLPADSDWTLYNQSLPDQWLDGFWEGGEPFRLVGLHPESEVQEGTIPRIVLRSFAFYTDDRMVEAALRPETVWLFPGLSMGVVVHRGSLPLATDDASEIGAVVLAAEDPGENRPPEHYRALKIRRDTRDPKDLSLFSEVPLLPERLSEDPRANLLDMGKILEAQEPKALPGFKAAMMKHLDLIQEKIDKGRKALSSLPAGPPGSQDLREALRDALDRQEEHILKVREEQSKPPQKLTLEKIEELKKMGPTKDEINNRVEETIRRVLDKIPPEMREKLQKKLDGGIAIPPRIQAPPKETRGNERARLASVLKSARARLSEMNPGGSSPIPGFQEKLDLLDRAIASLPQLSEKGNDPENRKKRSGMVRILHKFAPPEPDPVKSAELRRQVLEHPGGDRNFENFNLRGADLSGLDLTGFDFSGADLIGANLSGATLSEARFAGAWMAHANLSRSILDRTDFSRAALGCADFSGACGTGASFEGAVLTGAVMTQCDLSDCRFGEADLFQVFFQRSRIHRSAFVLSKFIRIGPLSNPPPAGPPESGDTAARISFEGCDFSGSDFSRALFMKIDFGDCNFSGCRLDRANFLECNGPNTRFDGASLKKTAFPKSRDFRGSSFRGADMTGANLRNVALDEADFRGAILSQMDGSGGMFRQANLSGVTAIQSLFQKADLAAADARGGNFRQALFLNADLRGADFSHGSLYKAGFTGAKIDDTTLWDQALTGKSNLFRERPE